MNLEFYREQAFSNMSAEVIVLLQRHDVGTLGCMRQPELTVENKSKQPSLLMTQYTSGRRGPFPVGCWKAADMIKMERHIHTCFFF